jgi:hypothetical protein
MNSVADQAGRIHKLIEFGMPLTEVTQECWQLRVRLQEELKRKKFLFVPEDMAKLYEETDPFNLGNKFDEAHADIKSAAKCLAVGEGTACILHLDRAMEIALRKLASALANGHYWTE